MRSADVVVIGAGVIGASVAYHLGRAGCRRVVVLERESKSGLGSTGRATGGFRVQFDTEINVRLSLLSRQALERFPDEVGADPGYAHAGYLFLARNQAQLDVLRAAHRLQCDAGVRDAAIITPSDISRLNPALGNVESVGGAFCPTDGFIRPLAILEGYQQAAERLGVEFRFGEACTGVLTGSGRVIGVETSLGTIATEHIVNAAGAWAGIVARYGGVELPVTPARRQVAIIEARGLLPENMPMTIFLEDGFHLRVRDGYALLLWPDGLLDPDSFDLAFDDGWLRGVVERARIRVPCLADAAINRRRSWAGLYEMSPDKHAILGSAPGLDGLFLVNGSSGHGVMHSPALGLLASEMILQGRPVSLDVHSLRPGRFAEGAPNRGSSLL